MECTYCNQSKRKEVFNCDGCNNLICKGCANLTSSEVKCLELKESRVLKLYCPNCLKFETYKLLWVNIEDKNKIIANQNKVIEMLQEQIEVLKDSVKNSKTYSQVVKENEETVVLVKPKDGSQKSQSTREVIQDKIDPCAIGASIARIKQARDGAVAICCQGKDSVENIVKDMESKLQDNYEVSVVYKRNPRIKVFNVNKKDVNNEEVLVEKIIFQNKIKTSKEKLKIKLLYKYEAKDKNNFHIILEIDPDSYGYLSQTRAVYIGWKYCRFVEYVNVIQCFKCCKFGHMAKKCRNQKNTCSKCAGEHRSNACTVQVKSCANCKYAAEVLQIPNILFDHEAFDRDHCSSYKRIYSELKSRIDFPVQWNSNNQ